MIWLTDKGNKMKLILMAVIALLVSGCSSIDSAKYISTDKYVTMTKEACLSGNKYKKMPQETRASVCADHAESMMKSARMYYTLYDRDEAGYNSCNKTI